MEEFTEDVQKIFKSQYLFFDVVCRKTTVPYGVPNTWKNLRISLSWSKETFSNPTTIILGNVNK